MSELPRPVAWIVSKPDGQQMRGAARVFGTLCRDLADPSRCNVPHLTIEILYPPLADPNVVEAVLARVAFLARPIAIPARGVIHEADDAISIELTRTPDLVDLRRRLATELRLVGAVTHEGSLDDWRPHLSVLGREHPDLKLWSRIVPHPALAAFSFPVASLVLSFPTEVVGVFREVGPFHLGRRPRAALAGPASRIS
jgi:hypothetical protein